MVASTSQASGRAYHRAPRDLAFRWKRFGYRRLQVMLEREGILVNHKKVYRLYKEAGLSLKKKHRKKVYHRRGMPERPQEVAANERWSMDFVSDTTSSGKKFRVFTLLDEVTREYLAFGSRQFNHRWCRW